MFEEQIQDLNHHALAGIECYESNIVLSQGGHALLPQTIVCGMVHAKDGPRFVAVQIIEVL